MSRLYVPPNTAREIQKEKWAEQRAQYRALLRQLFDFDDPVCLEWNPLLRELDPALKLGRAHGMAYTPAFGVRPGFYHWVRENDTAAPTVTPITNAAGGFREPDSGVLEDLRASDLQNPTVFMMLLERRAMAERAEEEELAAEREERQHEILERFLAATRTQVSLNTDTPWHQNAAGKRGAKR